MLSIVVNAAYTEIKYMFLSSRSVCFREKVRQVNQQVQYNVSTIKIIINWYVGGDILSALHCYSLFLNQEINI